MAGFKGGAKLDAVLKGIAKKLSDEKALRVGFLETEKYPDGTPVAQVAFWNEYGTSTAPPRPFFRNMIEAESSKWGQALGKSLVATGYDTDKALRLIGEGITGKLTQSIVETLSPELSPTTVMLRGMRSNDPSLEVTGKTVGEAAARVADGKTNYGASSKPLIDTGQMQRAPAFDITGKI